VNKRITVIATTLAIALAGAIFVYLKSPNGNGIPPTAQIPGAQVPATNLAESVKIIRDMQDILAAYRKTIVLLADEKALTPGELAAAERVGQGLFHENLDRVAKLQESLDTLVKSPNPSRFAELENILTYIESGEGLYDADRLAFREVIYALQRTVAADQTLPAIKLHKRISEDRDALAEIERNYEKEIKQIFGRFDQRAIELKRERWTDYVTHLRKLYTREQILKDYGVIVPYPQVPEPKESSKAKETEIFGYNLPPKTIALTFDDGPHRIYTEEIAAILKQYDAPAVFFQVGKNIGTITADGKEKLNGNSATSRKLMTDGYVLGNHSFSHALLSKETGDALNAEIVNTDQLLKAIDPSRAPLFRFPYGAHNKEGMEILSKLGLRSIKWNIDSLDWADPIPASIADRVLRSIEKEHRGIVLFHDIHERTVKALPMVLDRLIADGYHFAAWNGENFEAVKDTKAPVEKTSVTSAYQNSWAVVIGIDNYAKWPKLQYAVRDAQSIRETLINRFGFPNDHVLTLTNDDATRNNILTLFHDRFSDAQLKRDDRVFVFFAGHGATLKLSSGRNLGYIIPVDSDPQQISADAIPMTELQNIAESMNAKHVLFVMDACYSGLGLTRGGSTQFLKENARRTARQMLTAGGADQLVADGGPNGHSVFTWTLLQALNGKADLNGDGLITATELAAFVAPAVSGVSQQTPAFGSLPGSEGGEFVFELPTETEFLNAQTNQLSSDAIALNNKLEESRPASSAAPIVLKNLQGGEQKIVPPQPVKASSRQLAQRANDRGLQLYREKQYEQAEAAFTEALKHKPDFALAANNLGFVYYKQEKYAEAARWFENTTRIDPSRAVAYVNLGDAFVYLKETNKAKQAYKTYLELAPNGPSAAHAQDQLAHL